MKWDDRIGRRLRLKDLHTLQTVAEVGSMAKASERLALSQPAISKAISDMEHILGAPLLDRSSRGVELTECGRLLVERTQVVFDEITQGVSDIDRMSDPTRGKVKIGTTEPIAGSVGDHQSTGEQVSPPDLRRDDKRFRHSDRRAAPANA